ncbi:hypothetical protein T4D_11987 [Trichinella pseudospiralis]|uniref:Uncharacterized protein n=1 Tax=Trichinella pseudospiralis TaxID=6337 RepID=A0A0V1F5P7_TRIPS|nr:hypothetical protein T4D_11987 [Trichinella pseudospiralis]
MEAVLTCIILETFVTELDNKFIKRCKILLAFLLPDSCCVAQIKRNKANCYKSRLNHCIVDHGMNQMVG